MMKKTQKELQHKYDTATLKIKEAQDIIGIHTPEWFERKRKQLNEEIEVCENELFALKDMQATLENIEADTRKLEKLIGLQEENQRILEEEEDIEPSHGYYHLPSDIDKAMCEALEKSSLINKITAELEDLLE